MYIVYICLNFLAKWGNTSFKHNVDILSTSEVDMVNLLMYQQSHMTLQIAFLQSLEGTDSVSL